MNNKGQVLISFILILPLIIFFGLFLFENYYINSEKLKIDSISRDICIYASKNNDEEKIKKLTHDNLEDINDVKINYNNESITIEINKNVKSIFGFFIGNKNYNYTSKVTCRRTYEKE